MGLCGKGHKPLTPSLNMLLKIQRIRFSGGSRIFQRGTPTPKCGANILFLIFPKNRMKIKKFWSRSANEIGDG